MPDESAPGERVTLLTISFSPGRARERSCCRGLQNRKVSLRIVQCSARLLATPLSSDFLDGSPLDRWFCVPTFRRVCPLTALLLCDGCGVSVKGFLQPPPLW